MPPQPTMSPCPSTLQLSPSVCLRLLCLLLLLTDSSVPIRDPVVTEPQTQHTTTQANCSPECVNATDLLLKTDSTGKPEDHSLPDSSSSIHTVSHPTNQQLASPDQQAPSPATVSQTAVTLTFTSTGFSTQVTDTGPIASTTTATTMEHVTNVHTTTSPVTSKATTSTTTATSTTTRTSTAEPTTKAAEQPATTADATTTLTKANPSVALPTTTGTKTSPPPPPSAAPPQPNAPSTGMPPVQTSLPSAPTTVTSTSATADRDKPVSSGSRVAVVDVAGDALTSQLVDTAALLAVLLFGLLFFLVTVAVFVTQAYESYRRKDYTQVDYLINGMYSDSGV